MELEWVEVDGVRQFPVEREPVLGSVVMVLLVVGWLVLQLLL